MRLDTSHHMRLEQRMKLAPRMIQSMEILQLPTMALEERIDQELSANPMLEKQESPFDRGPDLDPIGGTAAEAAAPAAPAANDAAGTPATDPPDPATAADAALTRFLEDQRYLSQGSSRRVSSGDHDPKMEAMANAAARGISLQEELLQQWSLVDVDDRIRRAGDILIDWVDQDGYIRDPLDTICRTLPVGVRRQDIAEAWPILQQRLEPAGIAARDLRECLLLQIDRLHREQGLDVAVPRLLVSRYLEDLEMNRLPQIARRGELTLEQINQARQFMARHLSPRPGRMLTESQVPVIMPDAIIQPDEETGNYIIRLTDDRLPRLYINEAYARMARTRGVDDKTRQFLSNNLRNARWLIEAIEQRRSTLLRVLKVVVEAQKDFIEHGPEQLKPLPMTGVAEQLGIHVGTVSRAVADKYVQTPRGIFALRQFFTGGMANAAGEEMSWDAIKAVLLDVIENEDKKNPLNDDQIVEELQKRGIKLARRTVAKYRKIGDIPPARRRREF
ncbi:MAG: RNA polymerase factor sigma-54 [Phycisphaerales bacterium]|nr:RNA polymerase factor sigma-54 [Phycisphaerales bacterium]